MLALDSQFLVEGALLTEPGGGLRLGLGPLGRFASLEEALSKGSQAVFYAPDFFQSDPLPWLAFTESHHLTLKELEEQLLHWSERDSLPSAQEESWQEPDLEVFKEDFFQAQELFRRGLAKKVVPLVFAQRPGSVSRDQRKRALLQALRSLKYLNSSKGWGPSSWLYGYWSESEGEGLLGLSPELLFCLTKPGELRSLALAGTGSLDGPPLLSDPKQLAEHNWVVQGLCDRLGGLGEVKVGPTFEWALSHLKHLRTDMEVGLSKAPDFLDLVNRLHPTAALGSYPLEALPLWIERASDSNRSRGRFGAPFGFYQKPEVGPSWAVVAIRNLQWSQGQTLLGSGCGLVAQSQLLDEWNELNLKRSAVRKIFFGRS